jgi:GTP-binding protein
VVRNSYGADFVLADIPGLIEGASQGVGLGFDFLRHIERTRVLVHVVDASVLADYNDDMPDGAQNGMISPVQAVEKINAELGRFNPALLTRPQIIVANKMDLPTDEARLDELLAYAALKNWPFYKISGATGAGLPELMRGIADALANAPPAADFETDYDTYFQAETREQTITVERDADGVFYVQGPGIERMLGYTNLADERGFAFFQRFLRERGIIDRLEALGIGENDTVRLYEHEFDYWK